MHVDYCLVFCIVFKLKERLAYHCTYTYIKSEFLLKLIKEFQEVHAKSLPHFYITIKNLKNKSEFVVLKIVVKPSKCQLRIIFLRVSSLNFFWEGSAGSSYLKVIKPRK